MTFPPSLIIGISVLASCMPTWAQTASQHIANGRSQLAMATDQGVSNAHVSFSSAISLEPGNHEARFFRALCELLIIEAEPEFDAVLASFGSVRTGPMRGDATIVFNRSDSGDIVFPTGSNSSSAVEWLKQRMLPRLAAARSDLSQINNNGFFITVSEQEIGAEISLDRGDVLALIATLHGTEAFFEFLFTYNLAVPMQSVATLRENGELDAEHVLASISSLLTFAASDRRPAFAQALRSLNLSYAAASDFIQNHRNGPDAPPSDDLLFGSLGEDDETDANLRYYLQKSSESLDGEVIVDGRRLNLARHLSSAVPLRSYLPQFRKNDAVIGTLSDSTLGGVLPDSTTKKMEARIDQLVGLWGMSQYTWDIGGYLNFMGMDGSPTGDADGDGQSNFMEYVLGTQLTSRSSVVQNFSSVSTGGTGGKEVRLSFSRRKHLEDWNVIVSTSNDMIHWEKTLAEVEMVGTPVSNGDGFTETVVYRLKDSAATANRKFFRIEPVPR